MTERVEKKLQQIAKIEKRIAKWESKRNEESFKKEFDYVIERDGYEKAYERFYEGYYIKDVDREIRIAKRDLEEAKAQLEKIKKQEAKKNNEEEILNNMPEVIKEFMAEVIKGWNEYDMYWKMVYRREYDKMEHKEFLKKYGYSARELMRTSDDEINKNNTKDARSLVLNLWKRVKEITGEITDAKGLFVTAGNNGYAVINGLVIGNEGTARIDSIEAGGYNIQRWHIRTLVKEVA